MDRHRNQDEEEEGTLLVEIHSNLQEGYGCVLAPMIVDVAYSTTVPVCLFNPHSYLVVLGKIPYGLSGISGHGEHYFKI